MTCATVELVDLDLMRSFVTVADAGVITEAARSLMVTQSTLSRRVQQLETDLDVVLLRRTSQGVELTDAGRDVLAAGRELIDRHNQLRTALRHRHELERGSIRVGGGATATSFLLPTCIARFHAAHPGLTFYVKEAGSLQIADDVSNGRIDVGIVTLPIDNPGIELDALTVDDIVLVAPNDHALTRRPARPTDLNDLAIIGFESGTAIRNLIDSALTAKRIQVEIVAELRSIPTMLNMVLQTGVPAFVSRTAVPSVTGLAVVTTRGLTITRQLAVATRANTPPTPAIQAFIDLLDTSLPKPSTPS